MNQTSPFTPTFGSSPSVPVGRTDIVESFTLALRSGPGSPSRALLLSGTRGVGKTVLLNEVEDAARGQGWAVITDTASRTNAYQHSYKWSTHAPPSDESPESPAKPASEDSPAPSTNDTPSSQDYAHSSPKPSTIYKNTTSDCSSPSTK